MLNHVGNGQSHTEPAEPPRNSSPVPDRRQDSRPPSRARPDSAERSFRHQKANKMDVQSRVSNESQNEQQKQSTTTTPENMATPPTSQITTTDSRKPQGHPTANHISNAASSTHRNITPRWVKPSETKLEAVKTAAARESHLSRGTSPAPSSPDDSVFLKRRPISKGFGHGSDRGSNASQYDNVPGMLEQDLGISERPEQHHGGQNYGPSLDESVVSISSGPRVIKNPQFSHNNVAGVPVNYSASQSRYHTPHQQSPRRTTTEVPVLHPGYSVSLDQRGDDRLNGPSGFSSPMAYRELIYATAQRHPSKASPEKTFQNNSFATYRRPPRSDNFQNTRSPPNQSLQLEPQSSSTPIYMQQLTFTSTSQIHTQAIYRGEGHRRGEANPHYLPDGRPVQAVDRPRWETEDTHPPQSPGGMPRSPSFQQAQLSPVQVFTFPPDPDGQTPYVTQQQPVIRQQLPQLFGAPHYRHAQEAFALQESMLL